MDQKRGAISEQDLARPQPIDLASLGHPSAASANLASLTLSVGLSNRSESGASSADPDAWIAHPQPINLDNLTVGFSSTETGDHDNVSGSEVNRSDPDAWIAQPQAIDLASADQFASASQEPDMIEEDPDGWIARPDAIFGGDKPKVDGGTLEKDPDKGLTRPASIDLSPPKAAEPLDVVEADTLKRISVTNQQPAMAVPEILSLVVEPVPAKSSQVTVADDKAEPVAPAAVISTDMEIEDTMEVAETRDENIPEEISASAVSETALKTTAPIPEKKKSEEAPSTSRPTRGDGFFDGSSPVKPAGPVKSHFTNPIPSDEDLSGSEDSKRADEDGGFFQGTAN